MDFLVEKPKVHAAGIVVRRADIDAYGYAEARRRAFEAAGVPLPEGHQQAES